MCAFNATLEARIDFNVGEIKVGRLIHDPALLTLDFHSITPSKTALFLFDFDSILKKPTLKRI
jgi:hypothetical protein